ncbi:MAG: TonB family protein [Myxococcaceae bacterium]
MAKKITLQITGPDGTTSESTSEQDSIIVGSGSGAAIKVSDPKVSNLHCMFKVEKDNTVTVIDLGSESGTKFKDQAVKEPAVVASGETVMIGESKVKVVYGDVKAEEKKADATPPPPPAEAKKEEKHEDKKDKKKKDKSAPSTRGLAGTGKNAASLFTEPLPAEAVPTEQERVLQVALLWGDSLINVQHFAEGVPVTIGDGVGNRFTVFNVGSTFNLAQSKGSNAVVNVPSDAGLVVTVRSESHKSKEQLKSEGKLKAADGGVRADAIELGLHDRAQVSFDNVAFIVRYVRPSAAISINTMEEADFTFFKIVSICLMAFFALVAAMVLTPLGYGGEGDDIFANPSKYVKMVIKPEKKQEIKKFKDLSGVAEGAKAKEKEGKFGKQDAKKQDADPSKKGAPVVDANKREEDRKKVSSLMAGMFGGGASSNVFGPGGLGTGINNALGGLQGGAGVGDAQGVGGLGSRGSGAGGGGTGLGLGGLGTKGGGRGRGGYGSIDLGGKGKDSTRVIPGKTTVVGGLDKDVIMKVIKRHQNEIKFCYEQELQKNPALGGKVAVAWTIDPTGGVSEANVSESSIGNANVESCIVQRIRRWKFPEPQGGGVVNVTFPWIFKAAGDEGEGE